MCATHTQVTQLHALRTHTNKQTTQKQMGKLNELLAAKQVVVEWCAIFEYAALLAARLPIPRGRRIYEIKVYLNSRISWMMR